MIALVVYTDGRWDVLEQTVRSSYENLLGPITGRLLVVDGDHPMSAQKTVDEILGDANEHPWRVVWHAERLGFGGTIRRVWENFGPDAPISERFVFHLEDDFTFNRPVDLETMALVLDEQPHVAQLALRRQPWNDVERAAGGIVESWPDEYVERHTTVQHSTDNEDGATFPTEATWLEHRLFFTTNPSLYRRTLCDVGWPDGDSRTEEAFTQRLLVDPELRFAFWGSRDSGEAVRHIGEQRVGTGY